MIKLPVRYDAKKGVVRDDLGSIVAEIPSGFGDRASIEKRCAEVGEQIVTALNANHWTPIRSEEDLPKEDGEYFVAVHSPSWSEPFYLASRFMEGEFIPSNNVVAWMPIPPYQPKQEADDESR